MSKSEIERLQQELIDAQDDLLIAYRISSQSKADKALTRLEKARAAIAKAEAKP